LPFADAVVGTGVGAGVLAGGSTVGVEVRAAGSSSNPLGDSSGASLSFFFDRTPFLSRYLAEIPRSLGEGAGSPIRGMRSLPRLAACRAAIVARCYPALH
jgi:hypothetical protein